MKVCDMFIFEQVVKLGRQTVCGALYTHTVCCLNFLCYE